MHTGLLGNLLPDLRSEKFRSNMAAGRSLTLTPLVNTGSVRKSDSIRSTAAP